VWDHGMDGWDGYMEFGDMEKLGDGMGDTGYQKDISTSTTAIQKWRSSKPIVSIHVGWGRRAKTRDEKKAILWFWKATFCYYVLKYIFVFLCSIHIF